MIWCTKLNGEKANQFIQLSGLKSIFLIQFMKENSKALDYFKSPSFLLIQFCFFHNFLMTFEAFQKILRPLKYEIWLLLSHGIPTLFSYKLNLPVTIILQGRKYCELGWCCHMGFLDCFRIPNQSYLTDNHVTITWQNLVQVSLIWGVFKKIVKIFAKSNIFRAFIIPFQQNMSVGIQSGDRIFFYISVRKSRNSENYRKILVS